MCIGKLLGGLLGGGGAAKREPVIQTNPVADEATAKAKAEQDAIAKRRRKYTTLAATGGTGDISSFGTASPSASGKTQLGA